jgi:hypothetical protein
MDAAQALAQAALYSDNRLYTLVHLPAPAITAAAGVLAEIGEAFSALVVDKDEVSLVLPQDAWEEFAHRLPDCRTAPGYRLITFDLTLDMALVGFMALGARVLADAGLSLMAFSAFERDHILVADAQFQAAWDALHAAQARLKE